jgi:hypothetical protein
MGLLCSVALKAQSPKAISHRAKRGLGRKNTAKKNQKMAAATGKHDQQQNPKGD